MNDQDICSGCIDYHPGSIEAEHLIDCRICAARLRKLIFEWGKQYEKGDYIKADGVLVGEYNRIYAEQQVKG